jgi:hypothetical protein
MLSSQEKIQLLSNKISFLRKILDFEVLDLAELKKINHFKVNLVEADILDREASIAALVQKLEDIKNIV